MSKRLFLLAILIAMVATTANAGSMGEPTLRAQAWDFSVQTRYMGSQNIDGDGGSSLSVNSDLGWGLGFGYNANDKFGVGFAVTWRGANYTATAVSDSGATQTYSNWLDTSTIGLFANWYPMPKKFTPYVTGAIGWTWIDSNIPAGTYGGCWYDPWWGYVCDNYPTTYGTDAFSYSVGGGVRLEMGESVLILLGYEYDGVDVSGADGTSVLRVDVGITMQ
jgi:opacity protein-like surface antigen